MDGVYLYFDLGNLTITNESFEKLVFPLGIEGDRVHAKPPAVVPCSGPSELFVQTFLQPWKMVSFSKSLKMDCPCYETKIMLKVFQNLWKTERVIYLSHSVKKPEKHQENGFCKLQIRSSIPKCAALKRVRCPECNRQPPLLILVLQLDNVFYTLLWCILGS